MFSFLVSRLRIVCASAMRRDAWSHLISHSILPSCFPRRFSIEVLRFDAKSEIYSWFFYFFFNLFTFDLDVTIYFLNLSFLSRVDYVTQVHPLPAILARHLVSKDSHVHTRATHSHPNMRRDGSGSNAASLSGSLDQGQAKDDLVLMLVTAKGHVLLLGTKSRYSILSSLICAI